MAKRPYRRKKYIRRNSSRNPWRNTRQKSLARRIDWKQVMAAFLIVTIPLMCSCLSLGLLIRAADVYQYDLRASQAIKQNAPIVKEQDVIDIMIDFIKGKTDEFVLMEAVSYEPENVFNETDQEAMTYIRGWCRKVFLIGALCLAISFVIYFFLIRQRDFAIVRRYFKMTYISMPIIVAISAMSKTFPPLRNLVFSKLMTMDFPENDYLIALFAKSLPVHLAIFEAIASVVVYFFITYITFRLAGKRKLFKNREIKQDI